MNTIVPDDPKVIYVVNIINELFGLTVESVADRDIYVIVNFAGFSSSDFVFYTKVNGEISCYVVYGGWCYIQSFYDHDVVKRKVKGWIEKWQGLKR
jgi:hypothetical protein